MSPHSEETESSTDLIDVLYSSFSALPYRFLLLGTSLVLGNLLGTLITVGLSSFISDFLWTIIWTPISLVLGSAAIVYYAPWFTPILFFAWYLIFRGLYRVVEGRKPYSTFCELIFASYLLSLGFAARWWIGVLIGGLLVFCFYYLPFSRRWRTRELEYDTDGI